ncbi:IS110 family transposase [Streptomyces graminilatus]|uniref:IS110 family transposase n=1 Tax=Streptomyces graminilatus TaxID=1464070 RepID=UPI0006E227C7|nr:IS110 family transposase [Streptomyces graminilatus]
MGRWWAGIDWSWGLQDFVIIDEEGKVVLHLRVEESREGVEQILGALRALNPTSHRFSRRQVPIAIEDGTRLLVAELQRRRQPVVVIPPAVTSRYRGRHGAAVSKSDRGDAALLADIIRQNPGRRSFLPENSDQAAAIAVLARTQASSTQAARAIMLRLRSHLGLYFPAAVEAWSGTQHGLRRPEARAVLALAPTPRQAAALSKRRLHDTLAAAGRTRLLDEEAGRLRDLFAASALRQRPETEQAMGERTRLHLAELSIACQHAEHLSNLADTRFSAHPHHRIYRSFPACGPIVAARLFAEIGDAPERFPTGRHLRAYAGTAPITWSSGSSHTVVHRTVCNRALKATVHQWAFGALTRSPGCRALYDARRQRGDGYAAALRHVGNRLLSGLHHCVRTDQLYQEHVMFPTADGRDEVTGGQDEHLRVTLGREP